MSPKTALRISMLSKRLLLIVSFFLPIQPVWAQTAALPEEACPIVKTQKRKPKHYSKRTLWEDIALQKRKTVRGIKAIPGAVSAMAGNVKNNMMHVEYIRTPLPELAQAAYGDGPLQSPSCIVQQNEVKELLLPELIGHLSQHTLTAVGPEALRRMILVHDKQNTLAIQESIRHLVEHDDAFEKVEELLTTFSKNQRAFYRYWDPNRHTSSHGRVHLFEKVKELYVVELVNWFSKIIPVFGKQIFKPISSKLEQQKSPLFLKLNADFKIFLKFLNVFVLFGLRPVWDDIKKAVFARNDLKNPLTTFWDGVASAFNTYNIFSNSRHFKKYDKAQKNLKHVQDALDAFKKEKTTLEDTHQAKLTFDATQYKDNPAYQQIKDNKKSALLRAQYEAGQVIEKGSMKDYWQLQTNDADDVDTEWRLGQIGKMIASLTAVTPAIFSQLGVGEFSADGTLLIPGQLGIVGNVCQMGFVAYLMLARLANISSVLYQGACDGMGLIKSGNDLKLHSLFLSRGLRSITDMHSYLAGNEHFKKTRIAHRLDDVLAGKKSKSFKCLMSLAQSRAFKKRRSKNIDRGQALAIHPYMQENKAQLQPALWAIGELDALYSIAKLMRMSEQEGHKFCFVKFLPEDSECAQARIKNGTLLMVPNSKPNSMALGFDDANKANLTGPNGGGKSVFIKMFGCNTILAHACGVAVAEEMELHWLSILRTSIDPSENVKDEMSRFQAQKDRMDSVINAVTYLIEKEPGARAMFLTDEPLSGTTPNLAAMYMSENCERIKDMPQLIGIMATHNEEPTKFGGSGFVNYQVCVETLPNGLLVPSFKVAPGIPEWWFSMDPQAREKQKKFADYTTSVKHKKNLEKELGMFEKYATEVSDIIVHKNYPIDMPRKQARKHFRQQKEVIDRELARIANDLEVTTDRLKSMEISG